jgi:hypothetical protein
VHNKFSPTQCDNNSLLAALFVVSNVHLINRRNRIDRTSAYSIACKWNGLVVPRSHMTNGTTSMKKDVRHAGIPVKMTTIYSNAFKEEA